MKMKSRWRFRCKIVGLIIVYSAILLILFTLINSQQLYVTQGMLILIIGLVILSVLGVCESQMNRVEKFFEAISHEDFSQKYQGKEGSDDLADTMNGIIAKLQLNRNNEQAENSFLKMIIRQAPVAILVFDERERITLFNQAAAKLLSVRAPETIDSLTSSFIELPLLLRSLKSQQSVLHKIEREGVAYSFKFSANHIMLTSKTQSLVIIENIGREISQAEYQAWQKLISVLTHEMMNSITPIVSLADNCRDIIAQDDLLSLPTEILAQEIEDTKRSLDTIVSRSQGIMDFVGGYRELSRLPPPKLQVIDLNSALNDIALLKKKQLATKNIVLNIHIEPKNLSLFADKQHFEQVMLNLLINAIDACEQRTDGKITITGMMKREHIIVTVTDNGSGIPAKVLEHIFTPFFTTKRHGTGIGMTLSRQIMHAHGGQMSVNSSEGKGTIIDLIF